MSSQHSGDEVGDFGCELEISCQAIKGRLPVLAAHLEFGTTRMAARPWLLPTFARLKPRIVARLAAAARAGLRKAARS